MTEIEKMTQQELLSVDVINTIMKAPSSLEREQVKAPYLMRAKELKCQSMFAKMIKAAEDDEKKEMRQQMLAKKSKANENIPVANFNVENTIYSFRTPGWTVDDFGIYKEDFKSGLVRKACHRPMFLIKILKNVEDYKEKVKLCFRDSYGKWNLKTFDRAMLSSSSRIVQLAQFGVDVTSENCKALVEYLSDLENNNLEDIDKGLSTTKFGWQTYENLPLFIPFDTQIEFDGAERFYSITQSIQPKGSYSKWMALAKNVRASGRREPFIYLVASFSSVLVQLLNCLPYIVNLWTDTGRGKTVALMLACSVWANPEEGRYMVDPTSTRTALEQRCGVLNNLPLLIDDLSKMQDGVDVDFTNMIYFLCGGKGKERSNVDLGVEINSTWKNCILTNMERPLANETMRGGAINRILDFKSEDGSYFTDDHGHDIGREVVSILKENYGFAGRQFVEIIKNIPQHERKQKLADYSKLIKSEADKLGSQKEEKQIAPMAILLLTDEILEREIFRDGQRIDLEWAVSQLKDVDTVSEGQRAYDSMVSYVFSNKRAHFSDEGYERWGMLSEDYVYIFPESLKQISEHCEFDVNVLKNWTKKTDRLVHDRGKLTKNKGIPFLDGRVARTYCFKLPNDTVDLDSLSDEEKQEIPFIV